MLRFSNIIGLYSPLYFLYTSALSVICLTLLARLIDCFGVFDCFFFFFCSPLFLFYCCCCCCCCVRLRDSGGFHSCGIFPSLFHIHALNPPWHLSPTEPLFFQYSSQFTWRVDRKLIVLPLPLHESSLHSLVHTLYCSDKYFAEEGTSSCPKRSTSPHVREIPNAMALVPYMTASVLFWTKIAGKENESESILSCEWSILNLRTTQILKICLQFRTV